MDEPLQTMTAGADFRPNCYTIDANFDGYGDFTCTYIQGNQVYYDHLWIWNEGHSRFEGVPEYDEISVPDLDEETKTIYGFTPSSGGGTGLHTFHQWDSGNLLCMRQIEIYHVGNWGYQVSAVMPDEEPEDEALQYYYRNYYQPVLVLTDAEGGKYCFCYGFDGYTSVVSYTSIIERTSGEYEEVLKTVRLELAKRNRNQAPFEENLNEVGVSEYYDILVELNAKTISIDGGKTIWDKSGFWCTNYCSNNFVDCMRFGIGEVDTEGNSQAADRHIKQEYSAEQLLAFYQQGLDLQNRLIELYKRRHEISHSSTETGS